MNDFIRRLNISGREFIGFGIGFAGAQLDIVAYVLLPKAIAIPSTIILIIALYVLLVTTLDLAKKND